MRLINLLVVHCAATKPHMDIGADWLDAEHKKRGWRKIGYHYVIRRNGVVEKGRPDEEIGAHVQSHNANSIGICMVGGLGDDGHAENNFTVDQFEALAELVHALLIRFPDAELLGHRDLSPDLDGDGIIEKHEWVKDCPSFDVRGWWETL